MSPPSPRLGDLLELDGAKRPLWARVLYLAGAGVFFVLGIVGWLVPVVTGIPFYAAALVLLAMSSDRARAWINRAERRLPDRLRRALRRALHRIPSERIRRHVRRPDDTER